MNLDRLSELRDRISTAEFPVPVEELCARYEQLYTPAIADVLRELTLVDQCLPHDLIPLRPEKTVAGIAFTIKSAKDPTLAGELVKRAEMLDAIQPYTFCVWDTGGDDESAHWGEMMTAASKQRGARGAAVEGGLRDTHQVLAQDFPVFYRYRTPHGSLSRCKLTAYQVPIRIGRVIIKPGDVVLGDIDGVVVVPRDLAYQVLERAEQIQRNEGEIKRWILSGQTASSIAARGGYF